MTKRSETNRIIWHRSDSGDVSVDEIRRWHIERGFSDVGYHFVIRFDGTIELGRDIGLIGAHSIGQNNNSIGVCLLGKFTENPITEFQLKSAAALYYEQCKKYGNLKNEFHEKTFPEKCLGNDGLNFDREAFSNSLIREKGKASAREYIKTKKGVVWIRSKNCSQACFIMKLVISPRPNWAG